MSFQNYIIIYLMKIRLSKIYLKCLKKIKPQKETEYSERDKERV